MSTKFATYIAFCFSMIRITKYLFGTSNFYNLSQMEICSCITDTFGLLHDLREFAASKLAAADLINIQHLDIARQVVIAIFK